MTDESVETAAQRNPARPQVALFVTCLVDLMRPSVGFAAAKLLQDSGCDVAVPDAQTCCGQPAFNSGDLDSVRGIARTTIAAFDGFDAIIAPSASCAGMLKIHFPKLFDVGTGDHQLAVAFAARVYELTTYLVTMRGLTTPNARFNGRIACHTSCSSVREMASAGDMQKLVAAVPGATVTSLASNSECCGFGGLFSVKYPEISAAMAAKKTAAITEAMPDLLVGPDLGCLFQIAGTLSRQGSTVQCRHVAEVLSGQMDDAPICGGGDNFR